jgi:seryl-tRNA synthetase
MTPKVDYALFGRAMEEYILRGYSYVETPWVVPERIIRATLPEEFTYFEQVIDGVSRGGLVGSAEQGFLALDLPPGAYVSAGPCFRDEQPIDIFRRPYFMKIELFVTTEIGAPERVMTDAREVMNLFTDQVIQPVKTDDGYDLEIAGIEVGSYGERFVEPHGRWVYGTGLALPRFSVATALSAIT